jgi:hypothetical protein
MAFFIIYPSGDKSKLGVIELSEHMKYELSDYAVASRKEFSENEEAIEYAKQLAKENNLQYEGDNDGYLD